ncbi:NUDIX domain-containing protein, partial [Klebsiella pneumoniae]
MSWKIALPIFVICNRQGQVMWARRYGQHSWQFPQGGINPGES